MAKNKDPNIIKYTDGSVSDADPQPKGLAQTLADLGIDKQFVTEVGRPIFKNLIIEGVKKEFGLKGSELRHNSKAYKVSVFVKEIGWMLIAMGAASMALIIFFRLLIRWVGL